MQKIVLEGGNRLFGEVEISGSKNSVLPILAASILLDKEIVIRNVPYLRDVITFIKLLKILGAKVDYKSHSIYIDPSTIDNVEAPYDLVKTMRASILVLGPLASKFGRAKVSLPGGCAIGARPVNFHIDAMKKLGANVEIENGYIVLNAKKLQGNTFYFDIPSVTGTENLLMASVFAKGVTTIENAATEPEVYDLANFLKLLGVDIKGAGSEKIVIKGVSSLKNIKEYEPIPDRIEAATFMVASAITNGNILIKNCNLNHLEAVVNKLNDSGVKIISENGGVRIIGTDNIKAVDINTSPYPGFPTDVQAQIMALMCFSSGLSVITETIFENRFMHATELMRMGADIKIQGNTAIVKGKEILKGAKLMASDLRASASLILAGLRAVGTTEVSRVYHLDRGYENFDLKLEKLNAKIYRINDE
jgi:UDP-N-acetylglucosamine 1-carboxyvinyltransferase